MKSYRFAAGAFVAMLALGCGSDTSPAVDGDASIAASPDGQLAMASGLSHRPAEAGPVTVYKTPT